MPAHRREKIARTIQAVVSEAIVYHLSDPRIKGLVTVTRVEPSPDLRWAKVYLSVLGEDETQRLLSWRGIQHAHSFVQSYLADRLSMKHCPSLRFYLDDSLRNGLVLTRLFDQVRRESESKAVDTTGTGQSEAGEWGNEKQR